MQEPQWLQDAREKGLIIEEKGVGDLSVQRGGPPVPPSETISEMAFQELVVALARDNGFRVAHFPKRKMMMGETVYWATAGEYDAKGWLDLIFCRDTFFIRELKVPPNVVTPDQQAWIDALRAAGQDAGVWYPGQWDEIVSRLTRKPHRIAQDEQGPEGAD